MKRSSCSQLSVRVLPGKASSRISTSAYSCQGFVLYLTTQQALTSLSGHSLFPSVQFSISLSPCVSEQRSHGPQTYQLPDAPPIRQSLRNALPTALSGIQPAVSIFSRRKIFNKDRLFSRLSNRLNLFFFGLPNCP